MRAHRGDRCRASWLAASSGSRLTRSLTLLAAVCLLPACGGGANDEASTSESSTRATSAAPSAIDPCALVTAAEAEKALGAAVGSPERPSAANIPPRLVTCRYVAQRGQALAVMTVMVRQSDSPSEARTGFQSIKDQLPGAEEVPGMGDEAFWLGDQLNVLSGMTYVNIIGDFDRSTAEGLARTAVQRLP